MFETSGSEDLQTFQLRPDFSPNFSLPRHGWYRFKEGFSASLVSAFVAEYMPAKNGNLFDPFLGSGTTAVEGARLGHSVFGIEVNPFMAFLAKVKTRNYSRVRQLEQQATQCLEGKEIDVAFKLPNDTTLVERTGLDKWLLNRKVARRFEQLRTSISLLDSPATRDLLLLALMSSVEDVANARKDGKCWRYKKSWKELNYGASSLDEAFSGRVMQFSDGNAPTKESSAFR
jgi:hypothetical protein